MLTAVHLPRRGPVKGLPTLVLPVLLVLALAAAPSASATLTTKTITIAAATSTFTDTGIRLGPGRSATISATGSGTCHYPTADDCPGGPKGAGYTCASNPHGTAPPGPAGAEVPYGAVAGKVGTGNGFVIGPGRTVSGSGELLLIYNDCGPPGGYSDNAGSFQVTITYEKPAASLAVAILSPVGVKGAEIGEVYDVTVRVKARGGDFNDVRLSRGVRVLPATVRFGKRLITSLGDQVKVTYSPPEASGFPLVDGETRSFVFRVRAHRPGRATLKVHAIGINGSEKAEQTAATVVHTLCRPLHTGGEPVHVFGGTFICAAYTPH